MQAHADQHAQTKDAKRCHWQPPIEARSPARRARKIELEPTPHAFDALGPSLALESLLRNFGQA